MDEVAGSIPVTSTNFPIPRFPQQRGGEAHSKERFTMGLCLCQFRLRKAKSTAHDLRTFRSLFQYFGGEAGEFVVFHGVTDLDGIAANFTILNIGLAANRKVQHHRYFFSAIGAKEEMLH
jgi:hypothetical protein